MAVVIRASYRFLGSADDTGVTHPPQRALSYQMPSEMKRQTRRLDGDPHVSVWFHSFIWWANSPRQPSLFKLCHWIDGHVTSFAFFFSSEKSADGRLVETCQRDWNEKNWSRLRTLRMTPVVLRRRQEIKASASGDGSDGGWGTIRLNERVRCLTLTIDRKGSAASVGTP